MLNESGDGHNREIGVLLTFDAHELTCYVAQRLILDNVDLHTIVCYTYLCVINYEGVEAWKNRMLPFRCLRHF